MIFNDSKIFNNHMFSLPSRNCKWFPYFNQKEFLEVIMQRTAFFGRAYIVSLLFFIKLVTRKLSTFRCCRGIAT